MGNRIPCWQLVVEHHVEQNPEESVEAFLLHLMDDNSECGDAAKHESAGCHPGLIGLGSKCKLLTRQSHLTLRILLVLLWVPSLRPPVIPWLGHEFSCQKRLKSTPGNNPVYNPEIRFDFPYK